MLSMTDSLLHTTQLHQWLERIRGGDLAARDELLRNICGRMERLARKMLGRFPGVHRWVETDDVLQNALLRLLRALQEVQPGSTREFFGLAAEQMRRELLDLARHFYGPRGEGAHHASQDQGEDPLTPAREPVDQADSAEELERWGAFHQEVAKLPAEERELVGLIFYHGWTQEEVAELFRVDVRTIQRRWKSVLVKLHDLLREQSTG
jgi:RNA polymerase sigma factor (sigma-70 family)